MPDFLKDIPIIGPLAQHAIAVPQHLISGDIGKIPGDIFNNAADIASFELPGTGSILGDLATHAALGAATSFGSSLFSPSNDHVNSDVPGPTAPAPFQPKHEDNISLPGSLSGLSGLSSDQIGSNIATKGVYGGGEGPEENSYFANLINHKLISDSGQVSGDTSSISPIEGSYLNQLGLGGYSNPNDLLQSISKKRASGGAYGGFG